jgi:hypothetical protein
MSNLMKFMMTIVALAFLAFLNSEPLHEKQATIKRALVITPENKLPV